MTEFFLGAAGGFALAWLIWDSRWFYYSAINNIPFDDIWERQA